MLDNGTEYQHAVEEKAHPKGGTCDSKTGFSEIFVCVSDDSVIFDRLWYYMIIFCENENTLPASYSFSRHNLNSV